MQEDKIDINVDQVFRFVRGFVNFFRSYRKWSNKGICGDTLASSCFINGLGLAV